MARSGLERVGLASRIAYDFSVDEMLPAVGQGIVAVECAEQDWPTRERLAQIEDTPSRALRRGRARGAVGAQRPLQLADRRPCHARRQRMTLTRRRCWTRPATASSKLRDAARPTGPRELGRAVGLELLAKGAAEIIERSRPEG